MSGATLVWSPDGVQVGGTAPKIDPAVRRRLRELSDAELATLGYYRLDETAERPDGFGWRPVVRNVGPRMFARVWEFSQRLADKEEANAAAAEADKADRLADRGELDELRGLDQALAAYLELDPPTAADVRAQVDRLTRIVRRIVRNGAFR